MIRQTLLAVASIAIFQVVYQCLTVLGLNEIAAAPIALGVVVALAYTTAPTVKKIGWFKDE